MGILKAKLAKLRREALEGPKTGGNAAERGFEVVKHGDARVAVVGFPSTGKSTFLSTVTDTVSEAANCMMNRYFFPKPSSGAHVTLNRSYILT